MPDVERYFDGLAEGWSGKYRGSSLFKQRLAAIGLLLEHFQRGRTRALDYGCGSGVLSTLLANRFENVVAVDPSQGMREAARASLQAWRNVSVKRPDELDEAAFNFILCSSVVEYVSDDRDFLQSLGRRLSGEGILLISFPRQWGAAQMLNRLILKHLDKTNYANYQRHVYTQQRIEVLAESAGLRCLALKAGVALPLLGRIGLHEHIFAVMEQTQENES